MTWTPVPLKYACVDSGQYGLNVPSDSYSDSGVRLIRTSDINNFGGLRGDASPVYVDIPLENRHRLRSGDILLSRSGTLGRSLLVPESSENSTYAGYLVRFRPKFGVDPRFLSYSCMSDPFQGRIEADAVSSTIQNFNAERYANLPIVLPNVHEQRRVADFLDVEISRIDRVVEIRIQQEKLLANRSQEALYRSFVSTSGVSKTRLKYLLRNKPRYGVLVPEYVDDGVPFVRVNDLQDLSGRFDGLARISRDLSARYPRTRTCVGDVLTSVVGTLGRSTVVSGSLAGANVARAVASLRVAEGVDPYLVASWIRTSEFMRQAVDATSSDTAQPTLGMEDLANFVLYWPSNHSAQRRLAAEVADTEKAHSAAASSLGKQKKILEERKRALITAAVTGQVDVTTARGADVS